MRHFRHGKKNPVVTMVVSLLSHGHPGLGYWYPHLWKYSHFFTLFADQITMKSATQVAPLMRRLVHPEQLTEAGYEERFPKKSIAADCGSFWLYDKSIYIYIKVLFRWFNLLFNLLLSHVFLKSWKCFCWVFAAKISLIINCHWCLFHWYICYPQKKRSSFFRRHKRGIISGFFFRIF